MISITNYFKETSVKVKKFGLWLKGLIGAAAGSAYIQSDAKLALYLLVGGSLIAGILECLPPDSGSTPTTADVQKTDVDTATQQAIDTEQTESEPAPQAAIEPEKVDSEPAPQAAVEPESNSTPQPAVDPVQTDSNSATPSTGMLSGIIAVMLAIVLTLGSCSVIKPQVNHSQTDTTLTSYKQVDINVAGAKVFAGLNMDSLYHAALLAKDQRSEDSIARLNQELKYKQDSIAALKANKPIPQKTIYIPSAPQKQYVTDPQTKAQLSYWIDAYGKFQITCEAKDQKITTLQAQVIKLQTDKTVTTDVAYKTPVWNKVVMIIEGILLLIALLVIVFKSIL